MWKNRTVCITIKIIYYTIRIIVHILNIFYEYTNIIRPNIVFFITSVCFNYLTIISIPFPPIRKSLENRSRYLTFSKVRRAQNKEDYETWTDRNFANTLNLFDNAGPTRATELLIRNELFEESCIECGNDDSLEEHPFCSECIEIGYESWKFVRRMTPLEFERLQGFPDNWTDGMPDSFRYAAMGNAVAVPVVDWIIKRLMEANK